MGILNRFFGKRQKSDSSEAQVKLNTPMVPSPTQIKTVYSFVGTTTIMLDLNTTTGKTMVQQIFPFACQKLRQGSPEFNRLYSQVERENTPHVQGTGMATSPKYFVDAFSYWLKSKGGIDIKDAGRKRKICVFCGNAQNPQNGCSFEWGVLIYFDIEK